jgi:hypothetical protein
VSANFFILWILLKDIAAGSPFEARILSLKSFSHFHARLSKNEARLPGALHLGFAFALQFSGCAP